MLWFLFISALLIFPLCLKLVWLFHFWALFSCKTSRTKIAIVYAMTTLWHKRRYRDMHHYDMVCMLCGVWSLMCTSHVASNTQRLASMGKKRKSKAMVVINAMARNVPWKDITIPRWYGGYCSCLRSRCQNCVAVDADDEYERWCCRCRTIPK